MVDTVNPFIRSTQQQSEENPFIRSQQKEEVNPFLVTPQEENPFIVAGPMVNRLIDREYKVAKGETEGGVNLFTALEYIDRPRAAVVSGVISAAEGEDWSKIKSEIEKGWSGEQHPMMGEFFAKKVEEARKNPEQYPNLSTAYNWLNDQLESSFGLYRSQATVQQAITSGLLGDVIKYKMADTDQEKADAQKNLTTSLNTFAENVSDYYKEGAAIEGYAHIAGFGADVVLDPITYANPIFGFVKQGSKYVLGKLPDAVVDTFAKAGNTTKDKAKQFFTTNKVGRPIGEAADWAWSLFSTKHNLEKKGDAAVLQERFMNMVANARVQAIREGRDFQNRIKDFSRETGVPEADVEKFITEAVERGGVGNVDYKYLPQESVDLLANNDNVRYEVWSLGQRNAAQLQKEIDAGIRISPLEEQALIRQPTSVTDPIMQEYMARAPTPEAREAINAKRAALKLKPIGEREPIRLTGGHGSVIQRAEDWEGLTIQDINQLARDGNLPGYEGVKFEKGFFYDDPAISQAIRDDRHYRSMAAKQLADSIIDPTAGFATHPDDVMRMAREAGWAPKGKKEDTINKALQFLKEKDPGTWQFFDVSKNPLTEGFVMDRDIIKFVDDNINAIHNPKEVNAFLNKWDQVTGWWKSWTLSVFPSYHFRNSVGNMWNNFVVGVEPKFYKEAYKFQDATAGSRYIDNSGVGGADAFPNPAGGLDKAYDAFKTKNGTEYTYTQLRDLMDEHGVVGRGFMSMDIETTLRSEMGDARWFTLTRENKAIEIGKRTGEVLENNARIANFMDGLDKGLTPAEAAARVKKTLFDYSDLTKAEQEVAKRIMPFYTWSRKNIPFQIEQMVRHPGKYKAIDTLRQEVEAAVSKEDPNEKYLASWMMENYPTKVRVNEEGNPEYFIMGGWLPAADVWKLGAAPKRVVVDNLHPALKVLYEMTSADEKGYVTDLFTGQKLHPELTADFAGVDMPETVAHYLSNIRLLATIDDFYQVYLTETGQAPEKISPFAGKKKTAEEALIQFLTGFRTYAADLNNNRLFYLMGKQQEAQGYQKLFEQSFKRGAPQPELIEKSLEPVREMRESRAQGGMLDQARHLFRKGYAEGDLVTADDEAERDPESISMEGVKRGLDVRPEYIGKKAVANTIEGVTMIPGLAADIGSGSLPKGIYESTKAVIEGRDDTYEWLPQTRKMQQMAKEAVGVADIKAETPDEEVLGFLADPTLYVGLGLTKPIQKGEQAIRNIVAEAPNKLPGFYGSPIERAGSVVVGGGQLAKGVTQSGLNPATLADLRNLGYGTNTRKIVQSNVNKINKLAKEKGQLEGVLASAAKGSDEYKEANQKLYQVKSDISEAEKTIVGQMTYNANIAKQYGVDSPILREWTDKVNIDVGSFTKDNFKVIRDATDIDYRQFSKADTDLFFDHIKKSWGVPEGQNTKMVVRPISMPGGGNFSQDIYRSNAGKALREIAANNKNVDDFRKALNAAEGTGIRVIKADKGNLYVTFSLKSSSYAEGGVNVVAKVNPKTGNMFNVVSDDHDLFGMVPPGADRLIAVTPVQRVNLRTEKAVNPTMSELFGEKKKAFGEAKRKRVEAEDYSVKTPFREVKAELLEKAGNLSNEQRDIINRLLTTRSKADMGELAKTATGSGLIAQDSETK